MRKKINLFLILFLLLTIVITPISAQQELTSPNFKILGPTIDSGGGVSNSANFSLLSSLGNPTADSRLTSASYLMSSGFPSEFQANVPLIRCLETNTVTATTDCLHFPALNGAQGECGTPGCYDRAKIEIDPQNNPVDALFLVQITDNTSSIIYYLQSDNSISTTYDINDYQTICQIEGRDPRAGSGCVIDTDPQWDANLQRYNIFGLIPGRTYSVRVRALNGDFTETQYSPAENMTLEYPTISLNIRTLDDSADTNECNLGDVRDTTVVNTDLVDDGAGECGFGVAVATNSVNGMQLTIDSSSTGLYNGSHTIAYVDNDGVFNTGTEEYGIANTTPATGTIANNTVGYTYQTNTSPLPTTPNNFVSSPSFINYAAGVDATDLIRVMLGLTASLTAPTGSYSDTITFNAIGSF